jgi:hypothetical protein
VEALFNVETPASGFGQLLRSKAGKGAEKRGIQARAWIVRTDLDMRAYALSWSVVVACGSSGNDTVPPSGSDGGVGNGALEASTEAGSTSSPDASDTGTHAVGSCANLGAAGSWTSIAPVTAQRGDTSGMNYSEAVGVDPFDPATVWLATGYRGVFKSTDCGATWNHINNGRNSGAVDNGSHNSLALDPVHQGVAYLQHYPGGGLWKTTNGGMDWDQLITPGSPVAQAVADSFVNTVSMDPHDPEHLVLGMHATCNPPYDPTCEAESTDGGASWRIFRAPPGTNWEESSGIGSSMQRRGSMEGSISG